MKWVRDYAWVLIVVLGVVYFVWLRPERGPNAKDVIAQMEAQRADIATKRAEWEARRAELDRKLAQANTDRTLIRLRGIGRGYLFHLTYEKKPPQAADLAELTTDWKGRDDQPFEVVWGVDLGKLPNAGTGHRLAWEKAGAADGSRCVLLADGKTAKVVPAAEFAELPAARP